MRSFARGSAALYPAYKPYRTGYLGVSAGHRLYFEECGNPKGKPAVFLHGGPGGGTDGRVRRFFNPKKYRLVVFDQRGCGRSRPHGSLVRNTTWDLVRDIEVLRDHLAIERWLVFGGSWGSTLALAYAQEYPKRVTELVLRGIFLLRRSEIDWFYQNPEGAASIYPDAWERYVAPIPECERDGMVRAYHKRLTGRNRTIAINAARAWSLWEAETTYLLPNRAHITHFARASVALAFARIECHYFMNRGFFQADDQLLQNLPRIQSIPCVLVQGRYDVVCPMRSAWALHNAWPKAEFRVVQDAGHAGLEPGISRELVRATNRFA